MLRAPRLLARATARPPLLAVAALASVVTVGLVAGCAGPTDPAGEAAPPTETAASDPAVAAETAEAADEVDRDAAPYCWGGTPGGGEAVTVDGPDGEYELGGYEGWWNSTPADDDGGVLPSDEWPAQILEHPATATVYVDNAETHVLETYDRDTCGPVEDYVPPTPADLGVDAGAGGFAMLLDARTGEVLEQLDSGL